MTAQETSPPSDPLSIDALLFVVAAPLEARAVAEAFGIADYTPAEGPWQPVRLSQPADGALGSPVWMVESGVGKAAAAGATSAALAALQSTGGRPAVISLGIAGSLPPSGGPKIGESVLAAPSVFADEGVLTPTGFQTLADMGFAPAGFDGMAAPADPGLFDMLHPLCGSIGPVATVSTCSGTDAAAGETHARANAVAEAMEGAAVGLAASRAGVPFAEVRVISNTTGNRDAQNWELERALGELGPLSGRVARAVLGPS